MWLFEEEWKKMPKKKNFFKKLLEKLSLSNQGNPISSINNIMKNAY